jgi:hypothetical protein
MITLKSFTTARAFTVRWAAVLPLTLNSKNQLNDPTSRSVNLKQSQWLSLTLPAVGCQPKTAQAKNEK